MRCLRQFTRSTRTRSCGKLASEQTMNAPLTKIIRFPETRLIDCRQAVGGAGSDIGGVGTSLTDYQILQLDLNWKF